MNQQTTTESRGVESTRLVPGIYFGRLMSPLEVANAIGGRAKPEREAIPTTWTLCGDVSRELFELLQASTLMSRATERLTAFSCPAGGTYAVFTHQIGAFQHRFLLPLYDERAIECVKELATRQLAYSLGGDDTSHAVVWRSQLAAHEALPLQALCRCLSARQEVDVVQEYPGVVRAMKNPEQVPSTQQGVSVKYVNVCLIPPRGALLSYLKARWSHQG